MNLIEKVQLESALFIIQSHSIEMSMQTDSVMGADQQPQHFTSFANCLKEYIIDVFNVNEGNVDNSPNPFDLIKEFRSIAASSAAQLITEGNANDSAYNDWELEAKFWHLLELILSFRVSFTDMASNSNDIIVHSYNSCAVYEKKLLHENKDLYQIWIIMVWLQQNIKSMERPKNLPTSKWSNTLVEGGLKSADLDYPLRDSKNSNSIDVKDKEQDHIFFKYIYNLLLVGKFEEAFEECRLSENLTLSMILCGMQEYLNPKIDEQIADEFETQQGIKKHTLWRRTVYNLSNQPTLNPYERAIYSFISGTIPNQTMLETADWDTELLLHLNQILQAEVETYMLKEGKIDSKEIISTLPRNSSSLSTVLNIVSSKHVNESDHPIRVLVAAVCLDTLPSVLHSSVDMLLDIVKGYETSNDLLDEPYLLRIVTHLCILLDCIQPGSVPNTDKVKLVTAYISILKLYGLYDAIPIYVSFLDESDALEAYSFVLCTLEDAYIRESQIDLMTFLRLPIENILKRTTERVFIETEPIYSPNDTITVTYDVSDIDRHLIFSVEWLIEGRLHGDAIQSIVAMSRRLLINGKIESLRYFMEKNDIDELIKNYKIDQLSMDTATISEDDNKIEEMQQYKALVVGFRKYKEWQKAIKLLNSESNIPTLIEKFQDYSRYSLDLVKKFLIEFTEDEAMEDFAVLYEIRALYTPYLIIELHKGLVEAANLLKIPTFINDALGFTNLVANETDKIYLLFQSSGRLKEYLQLVAHTATLVE